LSSCHCCGWIFFRITSTCYDGTIGAIRNVFGRQKIHRFVVLKAWWTLNAHQRVYKYTDVDSFLVVVWTWGEMTGVSTDKILAYFLKTKST
jgi:hypothetical protein